MSAESRELFDDERGMRTPPLLVVVSVAAALLFVAGSWMTFFYAPTESVMGFVQKIFYFHVPAAWATLVSAPVMAFGGIAYLATKKDRWDRLSDAGVELAMLFGMMVLISGPLWGRKAWGVFWVWDVRLTSFMVLVLTLVACKIARTYAGPSAKTVSAGLSVLAVLNSIFVWISVDLWKGTHPPKLVSTLEPEMKQTLWVCTFAFLLGYVALLWSRIRLGKLRTALDRLHQKATEAGIDD